MSTDLKTIRDTGINQNAFLNVAQFSGSVETGIMIQLTQGFGGCASMTPLLGIDEPGYIQLSKRDVAALLDILSDWVVEDYRGYIMEDIMEDQAPTKAVPPHELVDMKTFIGCKVIRAISMDLVRFNQRQGKPTTDPPSENAPGYMVQYPDGYTSWSPKHVFEEAYREINSSEMAMCQ